MAIQFELAYRPPGEDAAWIPIVRTNHYEQALRLALHLRQHLPYAVRICRTDAAHTLIAIWPPSAP